MVHARTRSTTAARWGCSRRRGLPYCRCCTKCGTGSCFDACYFRAAHLRFATQPETVSYTRACVGMLRHSALTQPIAGFKLLVGLGRGACAAQVPRGYEEPFVLCAHVRTAESWWRAPRVPR